MKLDDRTEGVMLFVGIIWWTLSIFSFGVALGILFTINTLLGQDESYTIPEAKDKIEVKIQEEKMKKGKKEVDVFITSLQKKMVYSLILWPLEKSFSKSFLILNSHRYL